MKLSRGYTAPRILIVFIILFSLFVTHQSCTKIEVEPDVTRTAQSDKDVAQKFLTIPANTNPIVVKVAAEVKRRNDQTNFLSAFSKKYGFPVWDKALLSISSNDITSRSFVSHPDTLAYIPLVWEDSSKVCGFILAIINDSIKLTVHMATDYKAYSFLQHNQDSLSTAHKYAVLNIVLNQYVFGEENYAITDPRLFPVTQQQYTGKMLVVRPAFDTVNNMSIVQPCWLVEIWIVFDDGVYMSTGITFLVGNCGGTSGGSGGGGTWTPIITRGTSPGGPTGIGNGSGGGGGSIPPSYPCNPNAPVPLTNPTTTSSYGENPLPPCPEPGGGTGWEPLTSEFNRTSADFQTGDLDNNTIGNYDLTQYSDFDPAQQPWPSIPSVIPYANFVGWKRSLHPQWQCMDYAKAQIAKKNYKISDYSAPGQTFQIYTSSAGVNTTKLAQGLSYLKYALSQGIPVIVGVDDEAGSPNPGTDKTTDHFIVIVGMGTDTNGNYFTFYDNSSNSPYQGANANNKLYYSPTTGLIKGKSQTGYAQASNRHDYIVTMIRKSK